MAEWQAYFAQEPWGEIRDDMRAMANTLWSKGAGVSDDLPDLIHPYFGDGENDLASRATLLDAKIAEARSNASE